MSVDDLSRSELIEVIHGLEDELARLEDERDEIMAAAKRAKADLVNYKDAQDERKDRWQRDAVKTVAADLISVLDNLDRALASAEEDSNLLTGVQMVTDELHDTLQRHGIERIEPENERFDPTIHTAVDTQQHEEDNMVVDVRRPGYLYEDEVIREAEVVVGKLSTDTDTEGHTDSVTQTEQN